MEISDSQPSLVPAPWQLNGEGFILIYWFPKAFILENGFIPAQQIAGFSSGPSVVMLVNYHHSEAGPYQELLFIPGRFIYQKRRVFSITKIYVSTRASVVNGRKNWAIPKEQADFEWRKDELGLERIRVSRNGQCFARFVLKAVGPACPVSSSLIPPAWRTLGQLHHTHILFTRLRGGGKIKIAKCPEAEIEPDFFPNLDRARLGGALKVSHFSMTFPPADITPY
ncbi:MAG: acetoacetate decarboxylase family protein [Anaerolineae bacterium]|nr:acetoacetate decarboxylase family protein [Anaerolineae bacterium]